MLVTKTKTEEKSPNFCVWLKEENCKNFCLTDDVELVDISTIEKPILMDVNTNNLTDIMDFMYDDEEIEFSLGKILYKVRKEKQKLKFKKMIS